MGNKISRRKQINILLGTLFILVTPFCLYFFLYYGGQKDYFTNRNFRLLAVLGRGIEKKVDAIGTAYSTAAETVARSYYKPGTKCVPQDNKEIESRKTESLSSVLDARQLQTVTIASEPQNSAPTGLTLEIKREGGTRKLAFDYLARPDPSCDPVLIHAESNLDEFVSAFFNRFVNGEDFNSVFIADADGKLLYQWAPDELGLTDFNALTNRDQGKVDFARFKQNGNVADVVVAETDYKFFAQPIDLSLAKTGSADRQPIKWVAGGLVRTSHLNSQSRAISYTILIVFTFLLILVVLSFPFLKLVFMRSKDVMGVADIYFLAFSTLVGSAVLTAFLVYGLSYIGLQYRMDEQLKVLSDEIVRNFEAEVGSAREQLLDLNRANKLVDKLAAAEQADKDWKAGPAGTKSPPELKLEPEELKDELPNACRDAKDPGGQNGKKRCFGRINLLGNELLDKYPYLTTAAWVDPSGQQRIKWTTKSTSPSFVSVLDRAYFQDIRAKMAWNWNGKDYYLEPVYSRATGSQQVILSMPVQEDSKRAKEGWVSTLDLAALSLLHVVLPRDLGYGYCVINNEGDVLFHSDDTRNQVENFLRESDNDAYLRSVILSGETKTMDAQYLGVGHRLFVRSIPNTPWTLVTFRDEQIARAGCLEFIAYAIYLFCLYAAVLLLFWGIYYILKRDDRSSLLWPYEKRAVNYYLSIAVNLLLAVVFAIAIASFNRWLVVIVLVLLPAIGFLVHHYNLKADLADCGQSLQNFIETKPSLAPSLRGHNLQEEFDSFARKFKSFVERHTPLNYKHGYVLTLVSLLMLVSVFPMLAFFKFAYDREMRLFVGLGQINLARGVEERAGRIQTQYLSSFDREPPRKLVERRLNLEDVNLDPANPNKRYGPPYSDVYDNFFFNSKLVTRAEKDLDPQVSQAKDSFDATFEWIVPFENSLSLMVRGLTRSVAGHSAASLLRPNANPQRQILQTKETVDGVPEHTILRVESDSASLGRGEGRLWWGGLISILLIIPMFLVWLINFIGRRIFLLNTDEPILLYGAEIEKCPPSQNLLVLAASSLASKNTFLAREEFKALDWRSMNDARWREFEKQLEEGDINTIAINYFEDGWADSSKNLQKATLVEYLLARNKRVIVASTVDLTAYNFGATTSTPAEQGVNSTNNEQDRNTAVFNFLRRFYLEDTVSDTKCFVKEIEEYQARLEIDKLPPRQSKRVRRMLKTLTRECKSRAYLQQVGRSLLGIDDHDPKAPASDNCMTLRELKKLNTERLYSRVQDRCNAYYYALWETCSREEKLTLVQLATHHLVSSRNPSLRRLLRSGLVSREPFLRPMNETFSRFVALQATEFNLKVWKSGEEGGIWDDLKVPFAIILLVAGGFLFVSQRDLYNSTLAFVSAFAAAMPALFKVLGMFPGAKAGGT
jgi:hypothetical protein